MECGKQFLREKASLRARIQELIQQRPDWTGEEIYSFATRKTSLTRQRNSLQVEEGVVVMSQSASARLTPSMHGEPGAISRSRASNAIVIQGGDGMGVNRIDNNPNFSPGR